jgi:hypothetical protein
MYATPTNNIYGTPLPFATSLLRRRDQQVGGLVVGEAHSFDASEHK